MRNTKTVSDFDAEAHFRFFGQTLRVKIMESTKLTERQRFARQKEQFERLWGLEEEFRRRLIAHRWGQGTYQKFLHYITEERRNILAARPFFRERQTMFTKRISRALRKGNVLDLYRFRFNFGFMAFALKAYPWAGPGGSSRIVEIGKELWDLRRQIVEENLPLSINRARIFYGRTPKSHLSLMDEVQASANGMLSAVDKMCPPFTRVFRGVAIGRMVGNMIEDYCVAPETMVLTADLRWVRADSLKVDDLLVGFDENSPGGRGRKWRKAVVTRTGNRDLPRRTISTDRGVVTVSDEHLFLCVGGTGAKRKSSLRLRSESPNQKGLGHRWVRADRLMSGDKILFLAAPWEDGVSFNHGYLKGIADGEGHVSSAVVSIAQKPGIVFDEIGAAFKSVGIHAYAGSQHNKSGVRTWIVGSIPDALRFLGEVRPSRLLKKSDRIYVGKVVGAGVKQDRDDNRTYAVVTGNTCRGTGPVITLGTSTGTLVTEGLLSHNSATMLHFYPHDKRIIYRANKLVRHFQTPEGVDWEGLCKAVNVGLEKPLQTTPSQLALLMAAASPVSSNTTIVQQDGSGDSEEKHLEDTFQAPHAMRPDVLVEEHQIESRLYDGLKQLPMPAKKVLRLKGVEF